MGDAFSVPFILSCSKHYLHFISIKKTVNFDYYHSILLLLSLLLLLLLLLAEPIR